MRDALCTLGCLLVVAAGCGAGDADAGEAPGDEAAGSGVDSGAAAAGGSGGAGGTKATGGSAGSGGTTGSGGAGVPKDAGGGTTGSGGIVIPFEAGTPGVWRDITPPGLFEPAVQGPPFGATSIAIDPVDPATLVVGTDMEGIWKTTNGGTSWLLHNGNLPTPFSGGVHIDPKDRNHWYLNSGVRGSALGFWVTHDGGTTWAQPAAFLSGVKAGPWNNDVGHCETDPSDFNHVLLSFHSPWGGYNGDAGIIESKDGGETWIVHKPTAGWGASASIDFIYSPSLGIGDSKTWLLGTPYDGMWRTTDGGATWAQTNAGNTGHGGTHLFFAKTGVLYGGATHQMIRSTDQGLTWSFIGKYYQDEYYCVIGDGNRLYAMESNTGNNTVGPQHYMTSPENDGTTWTDYNDQTFRNGPYRMAFDSVNRIVYSVNWNAGVWALTVNP